MRIHYNKTEGVAIVFHPTEIRPALAVLKAIYKSTQQDFIKEAITDIESDLQPKLPTVNYFHLCHHCCRDLDERDQNSFLMTTVNLKGDQEAKWMHYQCIPLKDNRPV